MTTTVAESTSDLVRRLIAQYEEEGVDPYRVTGDVLGILGRDVDALRHALRDTLPAFVRAEIGEARRRPIPPEVGDDPEPVVVDQPELDEEPDPDAPAPVEPRYIADDGRVFRSPQKRAYVNAYLQLLRKQYATEHGYMPLGEMTRTDLKYAAELRLRQAEGMAKEAGRLFALYEALPEDRPVPVRTLAESVVMGIMQ